MSRDTTGQPVTASGTGKATASDDAGLPPADGPPSSSDGVSASATGTAAKATPAAGTPVAKVSAPKTPARGTPAKAPGGVTAPAAKPAGKPAGKVAADSAPPVPPAPAAPDTARQRPEAASIPLGSSAPDSGGATPIREAKPPRGPAGTGKGPVPAAKKDTTGPRRVRLAVSRLDPWSVMKLSFLLSIAVGIMIVVASVVFWMVLDGLHVFTEVNDLVVAILGEETKVNILQFVELKRVVSLSTMIAIIDVVLLTALATIAAFLYNVVAALVGGVHLTLTDE